MLRGHRFIHARLCLVRHFLLLKEYHIANLWSMKIVSYEMLSHSGADPRQLAAWIDSLTTGYLHGLLYLCFLDLWPKTAGRFLFQWTCRSIPFQYGFLRSFLRILPDGLRGSSGMKSTDFGHLYPAILDLEYSMMPSAAA